MYTLPLHSLFPNCSKEYLRPSSREADPVHVYVSGNAAAHEPGGIRLRNPYSKECDSSVTLFSGKDFSPRFTAFLLPRLIFAVIFTFLAQHSVAQDIKIGFRSYPAQHTLGDDSTEVDDVLLHAIASPLFTVSSETGDAKLVLTERLENFPTRRTWRATLKNTPLCSDGSPIEIDDLRASFGRCGWPRDTFSTSQEITDQRIFRRIEFPYEAGHNPQKVLERIAECPIFKSYALNTFGNQFGKGTQIIACGPFMITEMKYGEFMKLEKSPQQFPVARSVRLQNTPEGLSSLRKGTVDMLIGISEEEKVSALGDQTLQIASCYGKQVAFRVGLTVLCSPSLQISQLGYLNGRE